MPDTTPVLGLPYPALADGPPDVAGDIQALAETVEATLAVDVPPVLSALDLAPLIPVGVAVGQITLGVASDLSGVKQGAVLCQLPRRIVTATRITSGSELAFSS